MGGTHATLSFSGSPKWLACPGSVDAEWDLPDTSSPFAREGTFFHMFAAQCLIENRDAAYFLGEVGEVEGETFTFDEEMVNNLQPGLDWINQQRGALDVELWVDGTRWLGLDPKTQKPQGGTLDVGIYNDEWITIFDWKYGQGVPVAVEYNTQLMLYALCYWWNVARHKTNARRFRLVIWQPRVSGGGGIWECDLEELLLFGDLVRKGVARVEQLLRGPAGEGRNPGVKQCFWCKAKESQKRCPDYDEFNLKQLQLRMRDLSTKEPLPLPDDRTMTPERRGVLLKHKSMITAFLERLHADALEDAMAGRPTPGHKAVLGDKPNRQWENPETVEAILVRKLGPEKAYTRKVLSPAGVEKVAGKKMLARMSKQFESLGKTLISQGEGKPVLVDESNNRPAIEPPIARMPRSSRNGEFDNGDA